VNQIARGSTPLDIAVAGGSADVAKVLIDNGADVRRVYPSGRTPLHIAAAAGHLAVAELLIDRGADLNVQDSFHMTPMDLALTKNQPAIVNLLLEAGAVTDPTALRTAVRTNRPGMVRALLVHNKQPLYPLLKEAVARHFPLIIDALIEAGADVNARDDAGFTQLHDAALTGNLESVRILLEHGADINAGDKESKTALYMAATMGREEVVSLLLEKGADPGRGPSPLRAAMSAGFDRIAAAIKAKIR
jgi:ankyrin repeat protein